jgi:hypothetical protein
MITQRSIVSATAIGRMKTLRKAIDFVTRYSQYTPYFRKVNQFLRFGVFAMPEFLPVSQPSSASDANEIVILEEGIEVQHTKDLREYCLFYPKKDIFLQPFCFIPFVGSKI